MKNGKLLLIIVVIGLVAGFMLLTGKKSVQESEPIVQQPQETVVEPQTPAPASTPTPTAAPVESAAAEASEDLKASIQENLAGARKVLQQKAAIEKAKPEDNHHMPKVTLDAARRLGEIAELEAQHPEQAASFREFIWNVQEMKVR